MAVGLLNFCGRRACRQCGFPGPHCVSAPTWGVGVPWGLNPLLSVPLRTFPQAPGLSPEDRTGVRLQLPAHLSPGHLLPAFLWGLILQANPKDAVTPPAFSRFVSL